MSSKDPKNTKVLIHQDFSAANDMLTPKMSVKRRNVVKVYGNLIESLYK